jgi:hypothetical protein
MAGVLVHDEAGARNRGGQLSLVLARKEIVAVSPDDERRGGDRSCVGRRQRGDEPSQCVTPDVRGQAKPIPDSVLDIRVRYVVERGNQVRDSPAPTSGRPGQ